MEALLFACSMSLKAVAKISVCPRRLGLRRPPVTRNNYTGKSRTCPMISQTLGYANKQKNRILHMADVPRIIFIIA